MDEKKEIQIQIQKCPYNEVCSKEKICGDCAMDVYEREQYEKACENFKLDRKINRHKISNSNLE